MSPVSLPDDVRAACAWVAGRARSVRIAEVVGQEPEHPLMEQFAFALRDVGAHIHSEFGDRFLGPAEAADSIPALAGTFAGWDSFADVAHYEGREVPFYKRAQLAGADLRRAGADDLPGLDRLTAFADNLVPHVLRVDGILDLGDHLWVPYDHIVGADVLTALDPAHPRGFFCTPIAPTAGG